MVGLVVPFTNKARNVETAKNLEAPITEIESITKTGLLKASTPRLRIYSAHDFQIANIIVSIAPKLEQNVVHYASNIVFELTRKDGAYFVQSRYNGETIDFDGCGDQVKCPIEKWLGAMESLIGIETNAKADAAKVEYACQVSPTEAELENDIVSNWHYKLIPGQPTVPSRPLSSSLFEID